MITSDQKQDLVKKFGKSISDTGSSEVQIAILTERINQIANHLKFFPKDTHSRMGLVKLVGKKRRLCKYLKKTDGTSYDKLMNTLSK